MEGNSRDLETINTSYKRFVKDFGKIMNFKDYKNTCQQFNKFAMRKVQEGFEIGLPLNMGTLALKGYKQKITDERDEYGRMKGFKIDYKSTNELWAKCKKSKESKVYVHFLNDHTDGHRYRYFWSKKNVLVKNKSYYSFTVTKEHRHIARDLINGGKEYLTNK